MRSLRNELLKSSVFVQEKRKEFEFFCLIPLLFSGSVRSHGQHVLLPPLQLPDQSFRLHMGKLTAFSLLVGFNKLFSAFLWSNLPRFLLELLSENSENYFSFPKMCSVGDKPHKRQQLAAFLLLKNAFSGLMFQRHSFQVLLRIRLGVFLKNVQTDRLGMLQIANKAACSFSRSAVPFGGLTIVFIWRL